jgi:hypothetical protein
MKNCCHKIIESENLFCNFFGHCESDLLTVACEACHAIAAIFLHKIQFMKISWYASLSELKFYLSWAIRLPLMSSPDK